MNHPLENNRDKKGRKHGLSMSISMYTCNVVSSVTGGSAATPAPPSRWHETETFAKLREWVKTGPVAKAR